MAEPRVNMPSTRVPPPLHQRGLLVPRAMGQLLNAAFHHAWNQTVTCQTTGGAHLIVVRLERGAFGIDARWVVSFDRPHRLTDATVRIPGSKTRRASLATVRHLVANPPIEWRLRTRAVGCGLHAYPDGSGYTLHRTISGGRPPWHGPATTAHPERADAHEALTAAGRALINRGWEPMP